jgi:hypothetical protein
MPRGRFRLRQTIGLVIEEDRIALSVVARTPRGRREIARDVVPCDGSSIEEVLLRMLAPWTQGRDGKSVRVKPWVHVGLPEARVFQAAVAITSANRQNSPQNFFLEAVQATNVRAEDRIFDLVKLELDKQPLACLCACPRAVITDLIEMLNRLGTRVALVEPMPGGLVRASSLLRPAPRGARLILRCFLGPSQAIGVLSFGARPLFWHIFDLPSGDEMSAILAAYSTLWMLWRQCRITVPIDTVIVHGRPELTLSPDAGAFRQRTGARLIRHSELGYEPASAALGMALARPLTDDTGLNLARSFKPAPTLRDIFPWGELVLQGAVVGVVSLLLVGMAGRADARLTAVGSGLKAFAWAKDHDQPKLDTEKRAVQERLRSVHAFLKGRVDWAASLRKIAAAAPPSTVITSLTGDAAVEAKSRSGPQSAKKQLVINFAMPLAEDGSVPKELDGFLATLRAEPVLTQSFPLIEVSSLKANEARSGSRPFVSYSLICLPKTAAAPKPEIAKSARERAP